MPGTSSQLLLHIVTSTKSRTPWISTAVAERFSPYIGGIVRAEKAFCRRSAASKSTFICISGGGPTAGCRI
jgi:hypothetical protein